MSSGSGWDVDEPDVSSGADDWLVEEDSELELSDPELSEESLTELLLGEGLGEGFFTGAVRFAFSR